MGKFLVLGVVLIGVCASSSEAVLGWKAPPRYAIEKEKIWEAQLSDLEETCCQEGDVSDSLEKLDELNAGRTQWYVDHPGSMALYGGPYVLECVQVQ